MCPSVPDVRGGAVISVPTRGGPPSDAGPVGSPAVPQASPVLAG
ncbi:MAG: hypothetical protein AVDCRST_MAG07-267 [uncultured Frankineae bacterium]|uniref:Uncharacterized protein n=1 Tax=uncultured Frankineae bacterium TaxID=437475 RepID=A0A6J4KKR6_9ACTN|nr:MAG: hypothetical protein AVDCRST_MAG07-267 [uncultured Frankineae bacterium]